MALLIQDRVKETTTTTGTGSLALAGAMVGFRAFSSVCADQDTVFYALQAVDGNGIASGDWEVGRGTYTQSSNTISRDIILSSSNAGAAVNLSAGTKQVWIDLPAGALTGHGPVSGAVPAFWLDAATLSGANGSSVSQLVSAVQPITRSLSAAR
jgi:hypothetical protein